MPYGIYQQETKRTIVTLIKCIENNVLIVLYYESLQKRKRTES